MLDVMVHPADVQDRDGIGLVLGKRTRRRFPFVTRIFADGGYRGEKARRAVASAGSWQLEIVNKPKDQKGFEVHVKRWIVERTLAWLSNNRRLARDFENLHKNAIAMVYLAMSKIMLRRLAR